VPKRIQLRRTKGWRKPEGAIVVARPSRWGNAYRVVPVHASGPFDVVRADGVFCAQSTGLTDARRLAVAKFRHAVDERWWGFPTPSEIREHLAGHDLGCWCPLDEPCHADVLLEIANGPTRGSKP